VRETDLAIVGAGPAGLSTAHVAAANGVKVSIFDDNSLPGGQYFRQLPGGFQRTVQTAFDKDRARAEALYEVVRQTGVSYFPDATVWDIPDDGVLAFTRGSESGRLRAKLIVIAAGAYDRPVPFPGWTLPGVVTAGGLQNLIKGQRVVPGRRAVVAGNGPLVLLVAASLVRAGAQLVEAAEAAPIIRRLWRQIPDLLSAPAIVRQAMEYLTIMLRAGVSLRTGWTAIEAHGDGECEEVVLAPIDAKGGIVRTAARAVPADLLVLAFGLLPSTELLRICRAEMSWDSLRGGWLPRRSAEFETSRAGVFAIGDGSTIGGVEIALAEGHLMGLVAAEHLGCLTANAARKLKRPITARIARLSRFRRGLERLYEPPATYLDLITPETTICRCEDVTAGEVSSRQNQGYSSANAVKSSTRLSMGRCQGRNCLRTLVDLVAWHTGIPPEEVELPRARPPARPVRIEDLLQESLPAIEPIDHATAHLPRGERVS